MTGTVVRVAAIVRKEFRHLLRDPRILLAVLVMPIIQLLLFSYAISFDVDNVPTVVLDQDRTPASRHYLATYEASGFFDVRGGADDLAAVDRLFERNEARIAVVVPAGFQGALDRGEKAQVAVLVDGTETNAARIGAAYATALNEVYGQALTIGWAQRTGLDTTALTSVVAQQRTWYNPDRRSAIFLIPGLMVVIIMIVTVQQTAVSLVRERDQGTAEQLRISPMRRGELMVGKLLPWTGLALLDMVGIALVGIYGFGVPLRGSIPTLALGSALFVFAALGLGLIVSAVAPSVESANIVALQLSFLPSFLLSGFAFPLDTVPVVLDWISYVFPARYMVEVSRGVFLKGSGLAESWTALAGLAAYALVVLLVATALDARRSRR